jgi:hypothetical protein
MTRTCIGCGGAIPRERKRTSRFCEDSCRARHRRAFFEKDGHAFPPGAHVYAIRSGRHVFVGCTHALRTRVRVALAGMPPDSEFIGAVPGDADALDVFRQRFSDHAVSGAWLLTAPEILAFFGRQTS